MQRALLARRSVSTAEDHLLPNSTMFAGVLLVGLAMAAVSISAIPLSSQPVVERRTRAVSVGGGVAVEGQTTDERQFDWEDGCLKRANGASSHGCFPTVPEETRDCYCDVQCYKYKDCCQDILFITCHCGSPLTVEECSVGYSPPDCLRPPPVQTQVVSELHADPYQQTAPQGAYNYQHTAPQGAYNYQQTAPQGADPYQAAPQGAYNYQDAAPQGTYNYQEAAPQGAYNYQEAAPQGADPYQQAAPEGVDPYQQTAPQGANNYQRIAPLGANNYQRIAPQTMEMGDQGRNVQANRFHR